MLLSYQLYKLIGEHRSVSGELKGTEGQLNAALKENTDLQADLEYFKNQENLAKELKSKADFKRSGEEMLIIVPKR